MPWFLSFIKHPLRNTRLLRAEIRACVRSLSGFVRLQSPRTALSAKMVLDVLQYASGPFSPSPCPMAFRSNSGRRTTSHTRSKKILPKTWDNVDNSTQTCQMCKGNAFAFRPEGHYEKLCIVRRVGDHEHGRWPRSIWRGIRRQPLAQDTKGRHQGLLH